MAQYLLKATDEEMAEWQAEAKDCGLSFAEFLRIRAGDLTRQDATRAHGLVKRAIAKGKLHRAPCEVCGAEPVEAHHDDYARPLDVRWLCRPHHREWHSENPSGVPWMTVRLRLDDELAAALEHYCRTVGGKKETVVLLALRRFLDGELNAVAVIHTPERALDAPVGGKRSFAPDPKPSQRR